MLFEIIGDRLELYSEHWKHRELQIENLISSTTDADELLLNEEIFGEDLYYIGKEIVNSDKKRLDILAVDREGCAVIIELKKDEGKLGVEMQALQYLSNMSQFKGHDFFSKYCSGQDESDLDQFLNDGVSIKDLNNRSRIITIARYFDRALFSMGKWLGDQGISFKCISYEPVKIDERRMLNFSVIFDQISVSSQYPLVFGKTKREIATFWHNIGAKDQEWWDYLIAHGELSTSYGCRPGGRGEEILKNYQKGDRIFAYVSKCGCVGLGEIENLDYELIEEGSSRDVFPISGHHRHRKSIRWIRTRSIDQAVPVAIIEKELGIPHPIQTSSRIKRGNIRELERILGEKKD